MNAQREAHPQPAERESLGDLLADLMAQSSDLVKGEVALVKAEFHEKVRLDSPAALNIALGVLFGLLASMAFLAAGILALSIYTGLILSGVIFGAALGALAAFLTAQGLRHFRRRSF